MPHPLANMDKKKRPTLFILLLALTLITMIALNILGSSLQTDAAPAGIVSYELAGDTKTASAILDSWDEQTKILAGFNLGLDYLFLLAYSTTIALAIVWSFEGLTLTRWALLCAASLAWGQWLAAALDAVENAALLGMLVNTPISPLPELAEWCATIKFMLIFFGILLVLVLLGYRVVKKRI